MPDPLDALGFRERGQLVGCDDEIVLVQDAGGLGHGVRRQRMVPRNHRDADTGVLALGNRARHFRPQRILKAEQRIHRQIALVRVPIGAELVHALDSEREHS